jgi:hypothetical protein
VNPALRGGRTTARRRSSSGRRAKCHKSTNSPRCGRRTAVANSRTVLRADAVAVVGRGDWCLRAMRSCHVRFTAVGFSRSAPLSGRCARLSRRATAAQQGAPLPARPAAHRGDHPGDALLRRRPARRSRPRPDRGALARRAAHPGGARSDRA